MAFTPPTSWRRETKMASLEQSTLVEIHKAWQALDEVLARVPSGHMDEPGAVGQWSIKDLIGHVTTWEREAMRMVQCYLSEGDPEVLAFPDVDQFNERTTQEKRSEPLDELLRDFTRTHEELVRYIESLPEVALRDPGVQKRVRVDTFEHYAEHTANVRRRLDKISPG